ncbi:PhoH family protein [Streptococcus pneumoniae]|nr:PhoH family protein [Streptococcus pneumoniae]
MKEHSIDIQLSHPDDLFHLFGSNERHLRLMEEELDVVIHARTEIVQVLGEESACEEARQVIQASSSCLRCLVSNSWERPNDSSHGA